MATRIRDFDKILPLILALPEGTHFDCLQYAYDGSIEMGMQAPTQQEKLAIMHALPILDWTCTFVEGPAWWRYDAVTEDGIKLDIYAVKEAPYPVIPMSRGLASAAQ